MRTRPLTTTGLVAGALAALATVAMVLLTACDAPAEAPAPAASASPAASSPAATATATATAAPFLKVASVGTLGSVLTDASGRTLYIFTTDGTGAGKSACNGGCAANWPPLAASAGEIAKPEGAPGAFGTITREDGTKQVTYAGRPLYRYAGDQSPGDAKGQGLASGAWLVASAQPPAATPATAQPATAPPATSSQPPATSATTPAAATPQTPSPMPSPAPSPTPSPTPTPTPTPMPSPTPSSTPTPTPAPTASDADGY